MLYRFSPTGGSSELSARLNHIYQELEAMEADKAPAKASVILAGLGFAPSSQSRPTRYLKRFVLKVIQNLSAGFMLHRTYIYFSLP